MKHKKQLLYIILLVACMVLLYSMPVFASELTEADVEQAVAEQGKEAVTGNVFIWFLCAIAFLKVSQKIDSFMASLGINVGNTGGNMMAELLIAGRSLTGAMHLKGGSSSGGSGYRKSGSPGDAAVGGNFLSGGLAGSVGRQTERSAVNNVTGYTENSSIGSAMYHSSLNKGGDFANNVISNIAQGNYSQVGSIKGEEAEKAFISYMGMKEDKDTPLPVYTNMEIGGGRIMGTETSVDYPNGTAFGMYNTEQYMAPEGNYETVTTADNATWYKQYAVDTVDRTPYMTGEGKIAYHENIVQKLPDMPKRKDRV